LIKTKDGTFTLKSDKYNECYHSSEGALRETLYKHVYPAFEVVKGEEIKILDVCFGLGYNTFASIINRPKNTKLHIISPELDKELVRSLKDFPYPKEFEKIKHIIKAVSENFYYEDERVRVEVIIDDAREVIKSLDIVDILYQDAFSPKVNPELWSFEYFREVKRILKDGVLTTYSVATPIRCALYRLGFRLYTHPYDFIRKGTIASFKRLNFLEVDFKEKLKRIKCRVIRDRK
jgi:tRNA U34 5-methylaminomethyl-2-thiouridine-forming methyltransferase MnmC